jgi:hypothetical protein
MSTETIECCICFESIGEKNNCVTPCGHKFCFVCLTKALTNNNTCPCCREVLIEVEEDVEEDDESEYEPEDDESDGGSEEDENELTVNDIEELSLEDFNDNAELVYERMIKKGITTKEIMQMLFSDYYGTFRDDLNDAGEQVERKMSSILNKEIVELIKETKIKKEQMMFLREDKERNINALDMIALNYA